MSALKSLGAAIANLGLNVPGIREAARNRPILRSEKRHGARLDAAFDKHLDDIKPGAKAGYVVHTPVPEGDTFMERVSNVVDRPNAYTGSSAPGASPASVSINPNADSALYAHELGHILSQQTDVGHLAATLRHNPALNRTMTGALLTLPGVTAALNEGNDQYDEALAIAALSAAPTLVDEALATKHGLAMMDKAGVRATIGQRGKLAGGLMSYLAPAVIGAVGGAAVGDMFD